RRPRSGCRRHRHQRPGVGRQWWAGVCCRGGSVREVAAGAGGMAGETGRHRYSGSTHMTTTFESLGLSADLVDALSAAGITHPFPIQSLTIPDALAGRDVCGKAKTGSGKTLAFGLPLLERTPKAKSGAPTALVLVPTRELAVQVHDVLAPLGTVRDVRVAVVYGGQALARQSRKLEAGGGSAGGPRGG